MRLRRTERDMFGRAIAPVATERRAARRPRSLPPGLVPFLPVIALLAVLVAVVLAPLAGVVVLIVFVALIVRRRYRQVKHLDYLELRRQDPIWRSWDDFKRGVNRYGDAERPPR